MPDARSPAITTPTGIRVSDADREAVAGRLRDAAGEGRLTLAETEDRLEAAYSARFTPDLDILVADLPPLADPTSGPGRWTGPGGATVQLTTAQRRRLAVHTVLVAVLAALLVSRWALSGTAAFWPAGPLFWLLVSLGVHYRLSLRGRLGIRARG